MTNRVAGAQRSFSRYDEGNYGKRQQLDNKNLVKNVTVAIRKPTSWQRLPQPRFSQATVNPSQDVRVDEMHFEENGKK